MKHPRNWIALAICIMSLPTPALASGVSCDRACLSGVADKLVASIVAHDPSALPRTHEYAATENNVPAALDMMALWRTATAAKGKYYIIDPQSKQVFLIVTISEGPTDVLMFGRIKVEDRLVSEIELFTNRSRGDGGFEFDADGPGHLPTAWTVPIPPERRASRSELLQAGRSIFDTNLTGPESSPACRVMENGQVVAENPNVLKAIAGPAKPNASGAPAITANADGSMPIPCGSPPERPADKAARTDIIDEEQGIVVSMATVNGIAEPYLATTPTLSAFVPLSLLKPYVDMLNKQKATGANPSVAMRAMPASQSAAQIIRIYEGKIQGLHMLLHMGAPGSRSPWVAQ